MPSIFYGIYQVRLDEKRRLAIPSELLQRFDPADTSVYLRFARGTVDLYPGQRVREVLGARDAPDDAALRLHFSTTWRVTPDASGRIIIPEELLRLAGIAVTDMLVLIGVRDHLELMTQAGWDAATAMLGRCGLE